MKEISVQTRARMEMIDITAAVRKALSDENIEDGICLIYTPHTTAAITINGVTREGVGTGVMDSEMGIKKAEHDALKRAAVKFGIARELYKRESDVIEREGSTIPPTPGGSFPANPVARSLADLVTPKQLGMIRAISREMNVDPDEECQAVMNCKTDELSKRAASALIQHLQTKQEEIFMLPSQTNNANLRRAM